MTFWEAFGRLIIVYGASVIAMVLVAKFALDS